MANDSCFKITPDTTATKVFDDVYGESNVLINELNEFRKERTPNSERVPGSPLEVSFGTDRTADMEEDTWRNQYRIRVRVPELGGKAVDLLQTTTLSGGGEADGPYQVGVWRSSCDSACGLSLSFNRAANEVRTRTSFSSGDSGIGQPEEPPFLALNDHSLGLWVPGDSIVSRLHDGEGKRFEAVAEKVHAMCEVIKSLREGQDPVTVLKASGYSFSGIHGHLLTRYERAILKPGER